MKRAVSFFLLMLALLITTSLGAKAKPLILSGSTTVQTRILEPIAKDFQSKTGIVLLIRGIGSGQGFQELLQGKVLASVASSPMEAILTQAHVPNDGTYIQHVISADEIVAIVHLENGISKLSWQELAAINTGKISDWKELGAKPRKITVVTSHKGSATRAMFQKLIMKGAEYIKDARSVRSTRQEVNLVSRMKGGIGAVSAGFVKLNPGKVKVLLTKPKITRPLILITKGEPSKRIKKLLNYLKTDRAKGLFK